MRIGSLFSGIGGLELGLEWAGVGHAVWQVEQDPYCLDVLAHHWPNAKRYTDVRDVGAHNLAPVDVICGGFPCQDISYAGKGAGLAGARSGLWTEFARIVGELGPQFVVVENVAALFTRGIDQVLGTLADLGYDAEWSIVSAASVGAPHRRERVFIVAYAAKHRWEISDGRHEPEGATESRGHDKLGGSNAVGDTMGHPSRGGRETGAGVEVRRTERGREGVGDTDHEGLEGLSRNGDSRDKPGRDGAGSQRPVAPASVPVGWGNAVPVRGADGTVRLIPREAAEAGFESPLWPVAHGASGRVARLRALGNAVVPQCAEVVGRRLLAIAAERRGGIAA